MIRHFRESVRMFGFYHKLFCGLISLSESTDCSKQKTEKDIIGQVIIYKIPIISPPCIYDPNLLTQISLWIWAPMNVSPFKEKLRTEFQVQPLIISNSVKYINNHEIIWYYSIVLDRFWGRFWLRERPLLHIISVSN